MHIKTSSVSCLPHKDAQNEDETAHSETHTFLGVHQGGGHDENHDENHDESQDGHHSEDHTHEVCASPHVHVCPHEISDHNDHWMVEQF